MDSAGNITHAFNDHFNNLADFLPDYYSVVNGVTVRGAVVVPDKGMKWINPDFVASIAPTPILSASAAKVPQSMHYSQKTSFAPRAGFAWRLFGDDQDCHTWRSGPVRRNVTERIDHRRLGS